jgi:uncharacterized protein
MANVFIIHGTGGSPEINWFPWLKKELEKSGCEVFAPRFSTPENQSLESWLNVFEKYKKYLDDDSIVVGHSLGSAFLLSVLENLNHQIKAAFFISGFTGFLNNPEFDKPNKTFVDKRFDWNKIRKNCRKFYAINSDNDPYVPPDKGKELAKKLGVELILLKNAGHINQEYGYIKFDLLLEMIRKEL